MKLPINHRQLLAEFVGTFALLFVVVGVSAASATDPEGLRVLQAALAIGLVLGVFITATAPISGGHLNPAVTLGLLVGGKIAPLSAVAYILVQLLGACAGAHVGALVHTPALQSSVIVAAIPELGRTYSPVSGYLNEIILMFFIVFVIYGTMVYQKVAPKLAGLVVGLTFSLCILAGSKVSGPGLNPALWFAPSALTGQLLHGHALVYTVGPIVGAMLAGVLWRFILAPADSSTD
jgi:MIP family channel proteins